MRVALLAVLCLALLGQAGGARHRRHPPTGARRVLMKPTKKALRVRRATVKGRRLVPSPAPLPPQGPVAQEGPAVLHDGCAAMELRPGPTGPCWPHPSLTDWCLPKFGYEDAFDLLGRMSLAVHQGTAAQGKRYLKQMFPERLNVTDSERRAWRSPHYLYNKRNPLARRIQRDGHFKVTTRLKRFPGRDLPQLRDFRTCAVVGSAGTLLGGGAGADIDAHSVVFRSNQAPTKGFERDVGSRTDFRLVNSANAYASEDGNRTVCLTPVMPKNMGDSVARQVHKRIPRPSEWCTQWTVSPIFEAYRWTTFAHKTRGDAKAKFSSGERGPGSTRTGLLPIGYMHLDGLLSFVCPLYVLKVGR
mmetsp:Transcript_6015/g.15495  ORF Transcript_6015/g.15495 Transcript_6015/m.15495 type:complete len:359 (-) Transcript_6015:123-1199(-)